MIENSIGFRYKAEGLKPINQPLVLIYWYNPKKTLIVMPIKIKIKLPRTLSLLKKIRIEKNKIIPARIPVKPLL